MSNFDLLESFRVMVVKARQKCYACPTPANNRAFLFAVRNYNAIEKSLMTGKES